MSKFQGLPSSLVLFSSPPPPLVFSGLFSSSPQPAAVSPTPSIPVVSTFSFPASKSKYNVDGPDLLDLCLELEIFFGVFGEPLDEIIEAVLGKLQGWVGRRMGDICLGGVVFVIGWGAAGLVINFNSFLRSGDVIHRWIQIY